MSRWIPVTDQQGAERVIGTGAPNNYLIAEEARSCSCRHNFIWTVSKRSSEYWPRATDIADVHYSRENDTEPFFNHQSYGEEGPFAEPRLGSLE